jgi:hypothetical protein
MKMSPELRANWLMVKALCFPINWIMWMLIVGVALLLVSDLLLWKTGSSIALVLGSALTFMYFFVLAMFLPSQMVSMASSKQFCWLENLRLKLAAVMFICCFLVSLFIAIFLMFSERDLQFSATFLSLFCVASVIFCTMVVLAKFFGTGQFFIFIFTSLFINLGQWLVQSNMLMSVVLLCLIWAVFFYWWFTWKPQRFMKSYFVVSQDELAASYNSQLFHQNFGLCNATPKTLMGSMLLGNADGILSQIKRAISPAIVALIILAVTTVLFGHIHFVDVLAGNINFFMLFVLIGFAYGFNISMFRNLHRIWMFYDGARRDLPKYVESRYLPLYMGNMTVIFIVFLALYYTKAIPFVAMTNALLIIIFSLLLAAITLYVAMVIYSKTKASVIWNMWINGFIYLIFLISFSSGAKFLDFDSHLIMTCSLGFAGLMIALVLRLWTQALWRNTDILRRVN